MGLMDKFKNLFTEEVEEEVKTVKKEVRQVEIPSPRRETRIEEENVVETQAPKEEKISFPLYFDDKDFDDLEKPKREEKIEKKEPKVEAYQGAKMQTSMEKKFQASPIISPVYGILDKNYKREDIAAKPETPGMITRKPKVVTVDDIRNKAFGTLEDDLESTLLDEMEVVDETIQEEAEAIDIFEDVRYEDEPRRTEIDDMELSSFDEDELPEDTVLSDLSERTVESDDLDTIDDDTIILAKQLEEQKKKLEEINEYINESGVDSDLDDDLEEDFEDELEDIDDDLEEDFEDELEDNIEDELDDSEDEIEEVEDQEEVLEEVEVKPKRRRKKETEDLTESELLGLVDTMYEKRDEE